MIDPYALAPVIAAGGVAAFGWIMILRMRKTRPQLQLPAQESAPEEVAHDPFDAENPLASENVPRPDMRSFWEMASEIVKASKASGREPASEILTSESSASYALPTKERVHSS